LNDFKDYTTKLYRNIVISNCWCLNIVSSGSAKLNKFTSKLQIAGV